MGLVQKLLVSFYCCAIESVLTFCITVWYAGSLAADRKALQRVIRIAQRLIGCPLPRSGGDRHLSLPQEVWGYYFRPLPPSPPPTISSLGKSAPLISIITYGILEQRHVRGQDIDWSLLKFPFTGYRFISICCLMSAASDSSDWDSWITTPGSLNWFSTFRRWSKSFPLSI